MKDDSSLVKDTNKKVAPAEQVLLEKPRKEILFYQKSPTTVFWLSLLTLNFYNFYWFYHQWRNIRDSSGEKCRPFARAIFSIFYIHQLISRVSNAAQTHRNSPLRAGATQLAVIFIIAALAGNGAGRVETHSAMQEGLVWVFMIFTSLVMAYIVSIVQKAANYHNEQVLGADYDFKSNFVGKVYAGETIIVVIGILLTLAGGAYSVLAIANNSFSQDLPEEVSAQ